MPTVKAYLFTVARNLYRRGRCIQSRQVSIDEELRDPALSPLARALSLLTLFGDDIGPLVASKSAAACWVSHLRAVQANLHFEGLKGSRAVFNIKGNDYRPIAIVQYAGGVLMIRFFGLHEDYDKVDAESV
ncbi:MAG: type II toxin-antitoxin system HigB family toxin [Steroidobacteraceae bacterium]